MEAEAITEGITFSCSRGKARLFGIQTTIGAICLFRNKRVSLLRPLPTFTPPLLLLFLPSFFSTLLHLSASTSLFLSVSFFFFSSSFFLEWATYFTCASFYKIDQKSRIRTPWSWCIEGARLWNNWRGRLNYSRGKRYSDSACRFLRALFRNDLVDGIGFIPRYIYRGEERFPCTRVFACFAMD